LPTGSVKRHSGLGVHEAAELDRPSPRHGESTIAPRISSNGLEVTGVAYNTIILDKSDHIARLTFLFQEGQQTFLRRPVEGAATIGQRLWDGPC